MKARRAAVVDEFEIAPSASRRNTTELTESGVLFALALPVFVCTLYTLGFRRVSGGFDTFRNALAIILPNGGGDIATLLCSPDIALPSFFSFFHFSTFPVFFIFIHFSTCELRAQITLIINLIKTNGYWKNPDHVVHRQKTIVLGASASIRIRSTILIINN